jgi:hypothetical protein
MNPTHSIFELSYKNQTLNLVRLNLVTRTKQKNGLNGLNHF